MTKRGKTLRRGRGRGRTQRRGRTYRQRGGVVDPPAYEGLPKLEKMSSKDLKKLNIIEREAAASRRDAEAANRNELEIERIMAIPGWSPRNYLPDEDYPYFQLLNRLDGKKAAFKAVALDVMKKYGPDFLKLQEKERIKSLRGYLDSLPKQKEEEESIKSLRGYLDSLPLQEEEESI